MIFIKENSYHCLNLFSSIMLFFSLRCFSYIFMITMFMIYVLYISTLEIFSICRYTHLLASIEININIYMDLYIVSYMYVGRGPSKSAPCHISMSSRTNLFFFVVKLIIESFLKIILQKITDLF
jgi:hypothetical protein